MATEKTQSLLQNIVKTANGILEPVANVLGDNLAREEYFHTLGLEAPKAGSEPDFGQMTPKAKAYAETEIDADKQDGADELVKFLEAVKEIGDTVKAIKNVVEGIVAAAQADDKALLAEEIFAGIINMGALEMLRLRYPKLHLAFEMSRTIDTSTLRIGDNKYVWQDLGSLVAAIFYRGWVALFKVAETPEEQALNERGLTVLSNALGLGLAVWRFVGSGPDARTGFESFRSTATPEADKASDRAITVKIPADFWEKKLDNDLFFSLAPLPATQLGGGIALSAGGLSNFKTSGERFEVSIGASGGVFLIAAGKAPFEPRFDGQGASVSLTAIRKHDFGPQEKWTHISNPALRFSFGDYGLTFLVNRREVALKLHVNLAFSLKRGSKKFFPFSLIPETGLEDIVHLSLVLNNLPNYLHFEGHGGIALDQGRAAGSAPRRALRPRAGEAPPEGAVSIFSLPFTVSKTFGPVSLEIIHFELFGKNAGYLLNTTFSFSIQFGKALVISITKLGVSGSVFPRDDDGGFFGNDLSLNLKMPSGAGVKINTGIVRGGGFLSLDEIKGEYIGAIELVLDLKKENKKSGALTFKAVGIIGTKLPDGRPGFSMLVIASGEYSSVQPPMGFKLLGIGCLIGLGRTVKLSVLQEGLKTNTLKSILFPQDVIANVNRIVSDLQAVFPLIGGDNFLAGLMVKLGFGTPTRIFAEVGVIVEAPRAKDILSPSKIVLIGVVHCKLPDEKLPLLQLQVNFAGGIDFERQFFFFRADLYDSHLLSFTLTGSMVVAVSWGENDSADAAEAQSKGFVVSVGGFHPDFPASYLPKIPTMPNLFHNLDRVTIIFLNREDVRLTAEAYFAVTSNSVQFGVKAELYVDGPRSFNIYGKAQFDALFYFDPFRFRFDVDVVLALRKGDDRIMGIRVSGQFSGTTPYHIKGTASFEIWWIEISIDFEKKWGTELSQTEQALVELPVLFQKELANSANWRTEVPDFHHLHVSMREQPVENAQQEQLMVQPFGTVVFSQRAIPVGLALQKFSSQKLKGERQIRIDKPKCGSQELKAEPVHELFAADNYFELTESEKLSRRSFEAMPGGIRLGDSAKRITATPDPLLPVDLNYELVYTDDKPAKVQPPLHPKEVFALMKSHAAVARSPLSNRAGVRLANAPKPVELKQEWYTVATSANLKSYDPAIRVKSAAQARQARQLLSAANPDLKDALQIASIYELT